LFPDYAQKRLAKESGGLPGSDPLWNPRYSRLGINPQWKTVLQMVMIVLILTRAP